MSLERPDRDMNKLYPAFRERLEKTLAEVAKVTGEPWQLVEGYRSQERQNWLYAQGRTRPGSVVTWTRTSFHSTALAADVIPTRSGYGAPGWFWRTLLDVARANGLDNPAWGKGDFGHVQLSDPGIRLKAQEWVRAGFPRNTQPPLASAPSFSVMVNGYTLADGDAYIADGSSYVALRPITEALGVAIIDTRGGNAQLMREEIDWDQTPPLATRHEWMLPLTIKGGRGYVRAADLRSLGLTVHWDDTAKRVMVSGTPGG
jgi:hypothetical protein